MPSLSDLKIPEYASGADLEFFDTVGSDLKIDQNKLKDYVNKYYPGSNAAKFPKSYTKSTDPNISNLATPFNPKEYNSTYGDNIGGITNYRGPNPSTIVFGTSREPLRTLVHEIAHTELRSNPNASMKGYLDYPYTGLEKARTRYQALTYGDMPEQNSEWHMRSVESEEPSQKYEDMLAELKAYEATLPAGTHILNTPLGNHLFPTKDEKLAYLIHSAPLYTQRGHEVKMQLPPTGNWQKGFRNKAYQTVEDAKDFINNFIREK